MAIPRGPARGHRDGSPLLLLAVSLLATAPVWIAAYPPMVDLPEHASQVALLEDLRDPGFEFSGLFDVNWFTPYLFGYLLVYGLARVLGIVVACKLVVSLALAGLPLATALLMKETGTDRRLALLTIPAMYGFSYQYGFLNFLVAAPLGLVFLWLTMRHGRSGSFRTSVGVAVAGNVLFFCHALVCVFLTLVAACCILFEGWDLRTALRRAAPLAAVLPIMAVWGTRTASDPMATWPIVWDLGLVRVTGLVPLVLGVPSDLISLVFGLVIICLPLLADVRLNRRRTSWIPFLVCIGVLLLAPHRIFGTSFAYQRFTVFAVPFFLIGFASFQLGARHGWIRPAIPLAAAVWTAVVGVYAVKYQSEVRGFDGVLDRMAPRQRALSLMVWQDSRGSAFPAFQHFPLWYAAQKGGVVDPSFAVAHVGLVRYRERDLPRLARMVELNLNPAQFDWQTFRGADYRYFVVRASSDLGALLFRHAPCPVRLLYKSNGWWLYEKDADCLAPADHGEPPSSRQHARDRGVSSPSLSQERPAASLSPSK